MAKGIAHREWSIRRDDYHDEHGRIDERAFRDAVQTELALAEHIGERLGVAIVASPVRTRLAGGSWFTVGWVFKTATVPATRERDAGVEALEDALAEDAALVEDPDPLASVE